MLGTRCATNRGIEIDRDRLRERERERERENVIESKPRESELVLKHQSSGDRNGKAPANDAPWTAINSSLHA